MLDLAKAMRNHIEARVREMISVTLVDLRKHEKIRDSDDHRIYLSGKLAAYEEILKLIESSNEKNI